MSDVVGNCVLGDECGNLAEITRLREALGEIRSTCNYGVNSPDEALAHVDESARAALESLRTISEDEE